MCRHDLIYEKKKKGIEFSKAIFSKKTDLYSGESGLSVDVYFVDFYLCLDVIFPLPIVQSKHFNHPSQLRLYSI